jgi:ribonuclease P protein component
LELRLHFPKKNRLVSQADYDSAFKNAKKIGQQALVGLYKPNHLELARVGIIVSKRVAKSAVIRNRIRRIVRESFRSYQNQLKGFDIVIIMRHSSCILTRSELREAIDKLWEKLITSRQGH